MSDFPRAALERIAAAIEVVDGAVTRSNDGMPAKLVNPGASWADCAAALRQAIKAYDELGDRFTIERTEQSAEIGRLRARLAGRTTPTPHDGDPHGEKNG